MKNIDNYKKAFEERMKHVWFSVIILLIFAFSIIFMAALGTCNNLYRDAKRTTETIRYRVTEIFDGYIGSFNGLLIPIKDKIAEDPSFDELQSWLQSKEADFATLFDVNAYDGIALTYKNGYAHSWNYGDYSNYDPKTRPWYQMAAAQNGKIAIVPPYITYLSQNNQQVANNILMTISQKFTDEIYFDLDLKLPKIESVLNSIKNTYNEENFFVYNSDGQVLFSTLKEYFSHNVFEKDDVISDDIVRIANSDADISESLHVDFIDGKLNFFFLSLSDHNWNICITIPFWEVFMRKFFLSFIIFLAFLLFICFVYFTNRNNAVEFVERDRRLEVIENIAQKERIYVDVDKMIFFQNRYTSMHLTDNSYNSLYMLINSLLVDSSEKSKFETFLAPEIIKQTVNFQYDIVKERFLMNMLNKNGDIEPKTIEMRRLAFRKDNVNMVEISMLDAEESVDLLKKALKETELLKKEQEEEYRNFMSYICKAEDGVEELDIKNHLITRFFIKDGQLQQQTISYPEIPFELFHAEDRLRAHELYDDDNLFEMCKNQSASYAELRLKWNDAKEYHWCNVIVLGMPITEKKPFNVLVLIKDTNSIKEKEVEQKKVLEDAFKLAEQGSKAKGLFLSKMSHEIRTPLNAIIGYLSIAQDSKGDPEKVSYCIENSEVASRHLLQIINDVLDISSIESGKLKIAHEEFDLKKAISDVTTIFYQNSKNKGVNFETHIENVTEEWVIGDELRLTQVLMNLLSNSVKFTPEDGLIVLRVEQLRKDEQRVYMMFSVSDTGIGMSKEYMSRIFKPFEQEQANTARKYGGSGLGLSITNNLIQMMGGQISVQSEQNEGTKFDVTLFFDLAKNEHSSKIVADYSHVRVLVVDDKEDDCSYIKMMLKRCGVKADTVQSGDRAIKKIKARKGSEYPYDLCIVDWNMPEMNGCDVTKKIRADLNEKMPIIIATAYDVSEIQNEAIAAGANKVISKPLFQSTLFDLLVSNFGSYQPVKKEKHKEMDFTGTRILLAEDNPMNMDIAVTIISKLGIIVDQAHDGKEAYDQFVASKEGTYSLILMDVQMPNMDGYEATELIRKSSHPEAKTIPIIAMTANAFAEDVTEALSKGMNAHISKPVDYDKLFDILQKYTD